MRIIPFVFLLIGYLNLAGQTDIPDSHSRDMVFRHVNIIPMDREIVLADQDLIIRKGTVLSFGRSGSMRIAPGSFVIDASGKYLMPGLAEMHAHVPPVDDLAPMKEVLTLFLCNGVTTIRGMLGHPRHLELRSLVQKGEILGPRFITSGPSFNGNSVKTAADASAMVRAQKTAGYDFLKLHPGLTPETFGALVQTAKEVSVPFAGHVSYKVGIQRAIDAGYATIDHMDGIVEKLVPGIDSIPESEAGGFGMFIAHRADMSRLPTILEGLRKKKIWLVPTQCLSEKWFSTLPAETFDAAPEMKYMSAEQRKNWVNMKNSLMNNKNYRADRQQQFVEIRRRILLMAHQAGVGILLGSDAPQVFDVPGFSLHDELAYYVQCGLSPYEALKTGTQHTGVFLGRKNLGTIVRGAVADMILLSANPLEDIRHSRQIEGVVSEGRWLSSEWIQAALKQLEK